MSKASVLVLATRYDVATFFTYQWAQRLHEQLTSLDHVCFLLDPVIVCRSGSSLSEAISCVDFVVFYGHGEKDDWITLPSTASGPRTSIVNSSNVSLLDGRHIYAGCCNSLTGLAVAYISAFPNSSYIGYQNQFTFEAENQEHFRNVVNGSVLDFVKGSSHTSVIKNLQTSWENLRDQFTAGGMMQFNKNAFVASQYAEENRKRCGSRP